MEENMFSKEDMKDIVHAGCNAAEVHLKCTWPDCSCAHIPAAIGAAFKAITIKLEKKNAVVDG